MTVYQENAYRHGVGWSIWHLEWVTKYRHKVFADAELQKLCEIAFEEAAKRFRFRLDEYEVQPEHVHLLVHLRPSMSPSHACASSRATAVGCCSSSRSASSASG